ncbi:interleukin-4 [Rousettus aegyptiacus]|uniref:Interleukin-4 n=2 Tax=Rousettus TaxID=9406 RepID=A0A7J8FHJ1_ROUAE|nr:interleukin-4 [Rousettus aegyptiacus]KAF6447090.1 interleukin 4 [Rousettus aegyptiacus]BAH02559.1 interleukin-4 [Rousettus leschenaultii]
MGLTSQLIPALVCLLACTSNFTHGRRYIITLQEIIKTLNILTTRKDLCMELMVADVFAAPKSTAEEESFCKVAAVLREVYTQHKCVNKKHLGKLDRNLSSLASKDCHVKEAKKNTLKNVLETLKMIMQEKYSKS